MEVKKISSSEEVMIKISEIEMKYGGNNDVFKGEKVIKF